MASNKGYFKLSRGWRNSDGLSLPKTFCEPMAWLWLIENAAWKDTHRRNAKGELIAIKRGQLHVSKRALASAWGWSNNRVEGFLGRLETVGKVSLERGQSGTILTVENYGKYQDSGPASDPASDPARGQLGATQEERDKERDKEKEKYTAPKKTNSSRSKAWRDGDKPPAEWLEWAMADKGWSRQQAKSESERFIDYCVANGRTYKDWRAAWRQWCRSPYQKTEGARQAALHL